MSAETVARLMTEPGKPLIEWSDEQREAIGAGMHPHLIVAGAGSGKTTVMTARVLWLVGHGHVRPEQVLGLTFTNKAAGEFADRIGVGLERMRAAGLVPAAADSAAQWRDGDAEGLASADGGSPVVSTYHSFAQRLLADHGLRIGYEPGAALLNDVSRQQLAYRTVLGTSLDLRHVSRHVPTVVSQVLALDALLAERLIEPEVLCEDEATRLAWLDSLPKLQAAGTQMRETSLTRTEVAQLVQEFRDAKRRHFVIDFADQMRTAAALAADLAEHSPEVLEQLRGQSAAVLLDEYQDTSIAQRRMLQSLFGGGHPLMAVGDPCQAIYGWRGASVFNIDQFTTDFPTADGSPASHSTLTVVRRCAPEILVVANEISADLRRQHQKVRELRAPDPAPYRGRFEVARLLTVAEETQWATDRIVQALAQYAPGEIAVLCRKRADIAVMAAALDARGIAYDVVGVTALLSRPEIADLVAVLRVLHNPADNPAFIRILASPRWAFGVRDIAAIGRRARRNSVDARSAPDAPIGERLLEAVQDQDPADVTALCDVLEDIIAGEPVPGLSDEARSRSAELVAELNYLRRFISEPLDDIIARILAVTGLATEARIGPEPLVATRVHALDEFAQLADDYVGLDGDLSLAGFLQWLADAQEFEKAPSVDLPAAGNHIKLMTVHASKGLEFDAVVLPFLVKGVFPSSKTRDRWPMSAKALPATLMEERERPHMCAEYPNLSTGPRSVDRKAFTIAMGVIDAMEERRLAYVAVTRARKLVIASGHIWGATQKNPREPSHWLETMRAYIDGGGAGCVEQWAELDTVNAARPNIVVPEFAWPEVPTPALAAALAAAAVYVHRALEANGASTSAATSAAPSAAHEVRGQSGGHMSQTSAAGAVLAADSAHADFAHADFAHGDFAHGDSAHGDSAFHDGWVDANRKPQGDAEVDADGHAEVDAEVRQWQEDVDALINEWRTACNPLRDVMLPSALSTTSLMRLAADPQSFASRLARPMPSVSSAAASRGTALHAYIENKWRGELALFDSAEVDDVVMDPLSDPAARALVEAYEAGPFGRRAPHAVEVPFTLVLGGYTVNGRIDAVFAEPDGRWHVIDWKSSQEESADALQLAVYRLAWARRIGVDSGAVDASFHYVRTGNTVSPPQAQMTEDALRRIISGENP